MEVFGLWGRALVNGSMPFFCELVSDCRSPAPLPGFAHTCLLFLFPPAHVAAQGLASSPQKQVS